MPEGNHYILPTSFAQQRHWFLDQMDPGKPWQNMRVALRLRGELKEGVLRGALDEIVARHETLRTTFVVENGVPVQLIAEDGCVAFHRVDLSDHVDAEGEARRVMRDEGGKSFDLARGPLFRATLLRLAARHHILLLTTHHIVSDGLSLDLLRRELSTLYSAFLSGGRSPLPELPIQYADFAAWQRDWLKGDELIDQMAYWESALANSPPVLDLPADRSRPQSDACEAGWEELLLDRKLTGAIQELARQSGASLFMALLAVYSVLLARYTGADDIVVGIPISGRTRSETEGLIGCFVNTLPMRTDLSGEPSFRQLLLRVRETAMEAFAHQDVPFEKIVEELNPLRILNRPPIFQVVFNLHDRTGGTPAFAELDVEAISESRAYAQFDISLSAHVLDKGTRLTLDYNATVFEPETIRRMLGHYHKLLEGAVACPDRPVFHMPMLQDSERNQVLVEWNRSQEEYPGDSRLNLLFEERASGTPDSIAVTFEKQHLTYREVNEQANRVAHLLRKHGVGPESLVALCVERSPEMVTGILGILKAGGAYVPLDPAWPADRLAFMMADANAPVVLTQERLLSRLPATSAVEICFDRDAGLLASECVHNPCDITSPDDPAYVIYTSGSTGNPKGVVVTHRNVVRLMQATDSSYGFSETDVWTLFHSFAFDFSVWEIWGALLYGGRLVIVPHFVSRSPEEFHALLASEAVTVLNQTPSAFRQLIAADLESSQELALRYVIFGGEKLEMSSLRPWVERHGDEQPCLMNMYGITETTVHVTCRRITRDDVFGDSGSLIGRRIPDLQLYLLDRSLQPVPIGVPGEICVGGAGLAREYLNQPELTATKFVRHTFESDAELNGSQAECRTESRLYRSGDLAKWLPNGDMAYLGRIDDQVKIRGFRIELGEVESHLLDHPMVMDAAVLATTQPGGGDARLVAYFVPARGACPTLADIRAHLTLRLPDYMIPSAFLPLESLPLTGNGKLDRRRLPAPDASGLQSGEEYVPPHTPTEEELAEIFAAFLGVGRVGARDNFFNLGGHSLLATQVVSRIRESFGVELPLPAIFEDPTVESLAARVDAAARTGSGALYTPILPVTRQGRLPLSFAQQRLWFLHQLQPETAQYNVQRAMRLKGDLNVHALGQAISTLVKRHEVLRTVFTEIDGDAAQVIQPHSPAALAVVDISGVPEAEREPEAARLALEESRAPIDLAAGPVFRAAIVRLGPEHHALLLTMHHVCTDGWSLRVLNRELALLYQEYANGDPSPLPPVRLQYADYAVWQREWLKCGVLERQVSWWREKLYAAPELLDIPTDRRRSKPVSTGLWHQFEVESDLLDQVRAFDRGRGVTMFVTLQTVWAALLHRYSGQAEIALGTDVANRHHRDTEDIVGFFVNQVVLRNDFSDDPTFDVVLKRSRRNILEAWSHQDVPFDLLVERLLPDRDPATSPFFQAKFVLNRFSGPVFHLPGLEVSPLGVYNETAKFDISLYMGETDTRLGGYFAYNPEVFDASTIARTKEHFKLLLRAMIADSSRKVSSVPLFVDSAFAESARPTLESAGVSQKDFESILLQLGALPS